MKTPNKHSDLKPVETLADFKHRIALLMRNQKGGEIYSVIGAAKPDPCVVRNTEEVKENE